MAFGRSAAHYRALLVEMRASERLVGLLAFDGPPGALAVWRRELRWQVRRLAMVRLRPDARPVPEAWLVRWLLADDEPVPMVARTLEHLQERQDGLARNGRPAEVIAAAVERFHRELAARLAREEPVKALVEEVGR
jgi:hypothetical protein